MCGFTSLLESTLLARLLTLGWSFVNLRATLETFLSVPFLVSSSCCAGIIVASWLPPVSPACPVIPYRWTICGTKIADFVFSVSESLLEKLGYLQNFVYLKQEKKTLEPFSSVPGCGILTWAGTLDLHLQPQVPGI